MKQSLVINKKWILTASLLAVLATQYSYQTSSLDLKKSIALNNYKNSGEFVFASNVEDQAKYLAAEKTKEVEAAKKLLTESGLTVTGTCNDCSTAAAEIKVVPTIEELLARITTLEAEKSAQAAQVTTVQAVVNDSDCEPARSDETRAERRERIKCEKDEKAQAKLEAAKEKLLIRVEKFEDKMEALKEKCDGDLACLTNGFTSALSRFEGRNALPIKVVNDAFRTVVSPALTKAMYTGDEETVNASLASIQGVLEADLSERYSDVKKIVIDSVKHQSKIAANRVNANYAQLNELSKANNPQAYLEAAEALKAEHGLLNLMANAYTKQISNSVSDNSSMFSYYQKSYLPDMTKIMAGVSSASTTTTETLDKTNNTRDSRSNTTATTTNVVTSSTDDKMTLDKNAWLLPSENSGLEVGSPSGTSRGGRGPK